MGSTGLEPGVVWKDPELESQGLCFQSCLSPGN